MCCSGASPILVLSHCDIFSVHCITSASSHYFLNVQVSNYYYYFLKMTLNHSITNYTKDLRFIKFLITYMRNRKRGRGVNSAPMTLQRRQIGLSSFFNISEYQCNLLGPTCKTHRSITKGWWNIHVCYTIEHTPFNILKKMAFRKSFWAYALVHKITL